MSDIQKIALITGAARRIGANIAKTLHEAGYGVVIHYRKSSMEANELVQQLNERRANSAWAVKADLRSVEQIKFLFDETMVAAGRLDVLVNNASSFYPTPMGGVAEQQWDDLLGSNLKAPFFISQAAAPELKKRRGCIVNIVDIYAKRSLADYPVYSVAKAGLYALTESLAKELAPEVRVNGVSPGVILWPQAGAVKEAEKVLAKIPLQRQGSAKDIAETVFFLVAQASYITGQVIAVDGGKSLL